MMIDEQAENKTGTPFRLGPANEPLVTQHGRTIKVGFSVVVPAYQAQATLGPCLAGIIGAGFEPADILVVDDGSSDLTQNIARAFGAKVIANERNLRPAGARNRGVDEIDSDVVFFVDADVVIKKGIRRQLEAHFLDPDVTAVIGSYDDTPSGGSVLSDYRNLLHHHVHQHSGGASQTFWTGIGAVRRDAYLAAGGLRGNWENIEDVEFGLRLTAANSRIVLDPNLQGTHLKVWTLGSMFSTDLYGRAIPWSKLIQAGRIPIGALNTSRRHRLAAAGVALTGVGLLTTLLWLPLVILALCGILLFLVGIWDFFSVLRQKRGTWFALRSIPWHGLHYCAALLGFITVWVTGIEIESER
jgi:cellulose synthase/poly-beta-1,6-N-acetylglucosamine synthase-like glycosyltransferase